MQINDIIFQVDKKRRFPDGLNEKEKWARDRQVIVREPVAAAGFLTCDVVAAWFVEHNILHSLFVGPGAHVSLMERAETIIRFLEMMRHASQTGI